MPTFTIGEQDFLLDGQPYRILSGALHYFRIHPDHWADRIHKARLMGLNTIETYVPWSMHEPVHGQWSAEGGLDLGRFLDLVAAEGMHAIVRPGPYICAELDNGGLPAWLLRVPGLRIRTSEPQYLVLVQEYLQNVLRIVAPRQVDRGGPVLLVQVENEYGAYGSDQDYLAELEQMTRAGGITVPLVTVDQPTPQMLTDGSLPGVHLTGSFGSRATERLATLRAHQPTGPLMCMEFWIGWFDAWGTHHHTTDAAESAAELEQLLAAGASVNIYMFHGGTNFGLTSGANDKGRYQPTTTSYDYDAPLDEAGRPTAKFDAFREVIARYAPVPDELPDRGGPAPELTVELGECSGLLGLLDTTADWASTAAPPTFDELGVHSGLLVHRTTLPGGPGAVLEIGEVRDRVQVFLEGRPIGVLSRENHEHAIALPVGEGVLTLLVEDQGRVTYGSRLGEAKGLIGGVRFDGRELEGWQTAVVDLDRLPGIALGRQLPLGPALTAGDIELDAPFDLFLDTSHWGKGLAWVNGFCLGRYWRRGPQQTLFVPAPLTHAGTNRLVVLELEVMAPPEARFVSGPVLGPTEL